MNRLESLLRKEGATSHYLMSLERQLEQAGLSGQLPTDEPGNFCHNLLQALRELDPLAIGMPCKTLALYQTSQELLDDLIPSETSQRMSV